MLMADLLDYLSSVIYLRRIYYNTSRLDYAGLFSGYLGNSVAKIAAEKAGIIKPGCIVVNSPQVDDAAQVIKQVCHQHRTRLIQVGQDVAWHKTGGDLYGQTLTVFTKNGHYDLTIP